MPDLGSQAIKEVEEEEEEEEEGEEEEDKPFNSSLLYQPWESCVCLFCMLLEMTINIIHI